MESLRFLNEQQDDYLKLAALLSTNPPGSLAALLPNPSPPESSADSSSSPSGSNYSGTSLPPLTASSSSSARNDSTVTVAPERTISHHAHNDKRKKSTTENESNGALKDRRSSGGSNDGTHSHGVFEDEDADADDRGEDDGTLEDGVKGKGKTSDRRKAQNRQAQRAFRERKEKHLKELEDRVYSLEKSSTDALDENAVLKQLLQRLQGENERLKLYEQAAFSFSFDKDVSTSGAMPISSHFDNPTNTIKPLTPPADPYSPSAAAASSSFNPNLFNLTSFNDQNSSSMFAPSTSTSNSTSTSTSSSSNSTPFSTAYSSNPTFASLPSSNDNNMNVDSNSNLEEFDFLRSVNNNGGTGGSSFSLLDLPQTDLFSSYRDYNEPTPSAVPTNFDSVFNSLSTSAQVTSESANEDDVNPLAAYLTTPSPSAAPSPLPMMDSVVATTTATTKSLLNPCPGGLPHPLLAPGQKYEFDLDNLCDEMKAKATCQEIARKALQQAMEEDAATTDLLFPASAQLGGGQRGM